MQETRKRQKRVVKEQEQQNNLDPASGSSYMEWRELVTSSAEFQESWLFLQHGLNSFQFTICNCTEQSMVITIMVVVLELLHATQPLTHFHFHHLDHHFSVWRGPRKLPHAPPSTVVVAVTWKCLFGSTLEVIQRVFKSNPIQSNPIQITKSI